WVPANRTPTANGVQEVTATRVSGGDCAGMTASCGTINVGGTTAVLPQGLQSSQNSAIALYSIKGNKVQNNTNLPAGIYLVKSKFSTTKIAHKGGVLKIDAPLFSNSTSKTVLAKPGDYGEWTITVSADGYTTQARKFSPDAGLNGEENFELKKFEALQCKDFTETVGSVSFDMICIPGGTFTIGCEAASGCPANTKAVSGVTVSNYFIAKTEVTTGLYNAVMGKTCSGYMCQPNNSHTSMTWYDAMEFACKLSNLTGKNYRMTTEAEWEYAAKKPNSSGMSNMNSTEEWAYNSWNASHSGGTDPVGSGGHTQKTRRDAQGTGDNITGRLIRSIEGIGPALRLTLSADVAYPPDYVSPCDLHAPHMSGEPENSYRDMRWVTGSNAKWKSQGATAYYGIDLMVWEDGTARSGSTNGQWFTSNNITFVFVPNSGSAKRYAYIFLDEENGSLIADFTGRIERVEADHVDKPTIANLQSGEDLAKAQANFATYYKMVDMTNPPKTEQDARLLDGPSQGWFQHNVGSVHHYRKDVDADEFRFTVNDNSAGGPGRTMLANGTWFTVNNTFLRVTHSSGYTAEYLYNVTDGSNPSFSHNSFMGYERGDFRMFQKTDNNSSTFTGACGNLCNDEIPKGLDASFYSNAQFIDPKVGNSTFVPAPCPAGGCK
ncbi:MAG: formylglycine-generating enzyme family protein, partial [Fibromonadales bacterium]|nr:formylglycine-generating enzyme family protein [Fibromonadales bacterium]